MQSTAVVLASSILNKCNIVTTVEQLPEDGNSSSSSEGPAPLFNHIHTFLCRSATDSRRGIYYAISWKELLQNALCNPGEWGSSDVWNIYPVEEAPKKQRESRTPHKKRKMMKTIPEDGYKSEGSSSAHSDGDYKEQDDAESVDLDVPDESDAPESEVEDEIPVPRTPSKKRKRMKTSSLPSTPRRKRTSKGLAAPTPHSKAALRARAKKKMTVRPPPGADIVGNVWYSLENIPKDPWLRAMHVLHVASRPEALPCREEEYGKVLRSVEELVEEGSGGCVCESEFITFLSQPSLTSTYRHIWCTWDR